MRVFCIMNIYGYEKNINNRKPNASIGKDIRKNDSD